MLNRIDTDETNPDCSGKPTANDSEARTCNEKQVTKA
jgi:hypothetical protein